MGFKEKWIKERDRKMRARRASHFEKKRAAAKTPSATPPTFRPQNAKGGGVSLPGGGAAAWSFPKGVSKTARTPTTKQAASAPPSPKVSSSAPRTSRAPSVATPPRSKPAVPHQAGASAGQSRAPARPRPPSTTPSSPAKATPSPTSGGTLGSQIAKFHAPRGSEYVAAGLGVGLLAKIKMRRRAAAKAARTSTTTEAAQGGAKMTLGDIGAAGSTSGSAPKAKMTLGDIGAKTAKAPKVSSKAPPAPPAPKPDGAKGTPAMSRDQLQAQLDKAAAQNKKLGGKGSSMVTKGGKPKVKSPAQGTPAPAAPAKPSSDLQKQLAEAQAENKRLKARKQGGAKTEAPKPAAPAKPSVSVHDQLLAERDALKKSIAEKKAGKPAVKTETPTTPKPAAKPPATGESSADLRKQLEKAAAENKALGGKGSKIPLQPNAPKVTPVEQTPEAPPTRTVVRRKKGQTRTEAIGAKPEIPAPAKNTPNKGAVRVADAQRAAEKYAKLRDAQVRPEEKGGPKRVTKEQRINTPKPKVVKKTAAETYDAAKEAGRKARIADRMMGTDTKQPPAPKPPTGSFEEIEHQAGARSPAEVKASTDRIKAENQAKAAQSAHEDAVKRSQGKQTTADKEWAKASETVKQKVRADLDKRPEYPTQKQTDEFVAKQKDLVKPAPKPRSKEVLRPQTKGESVGSAAASPQPSREAEIKARRAAADKFLAKARAKGRTAAVTDEQGNKVGEVAAKSKRAAKSKASRTSNAMAKRAAARQARLARDAAEISQTSGRAAKAAKVGALGLAAVAGGSILAAQEARAAGATRGEAAKAAGKEGAVGAGIVGGVAAGAKVPGVRAVARRAGPLGILAGLGLGSYAGYSAEKARQAAGGKHQISPGVDLLEAAGKGGAEATMVPTIFRALREGKNLGRDLLNSYLERRASQQKYGSVEAATRTRHERAKRKAKKNA